jgi:putative transposase
MTRLARIVIPGIAHHVTQRGNRREPVFFNDDDYRVYIALVGRAARASGTRIWGFCLMPNHVHFILVPSDPDGLRRTFAEAHKRYTGRVNARHGWTGHLWQGRFYSTPMDERHLSAAIRYVAMNPVAAGLVERPQDWRWSSVHTHLAAREGGFVEVAPVLSRTGPFLEFLRQEADAPATRNLEASASTGRPVGSAEWLAGLEASVGRPLAPAKRGRKPTRNSVTVY